MFPNPHLCLFQYYQHNISNLRSVFSAILLRGTGIPTSAYLTTALLWTLVGLLDVEHFSPGPRSTTSPGVDDADVVVVGEQLRGASGAEVDGM